MPSGACTRPRSLGRTKRRSSNGTPGSGTAAPAGDERETIDALLAERGVDVVTIDGWRAIDRRELESGREAQRPRVKLASRDELLDASRATQRA